jgi:hypothetical protein
MGNYLESKKAARRYAKCLNKIPIDDLLSVFHEQLRKFFFSKAELYAPFRQRGRCDQ